MEVRWVSVELEESAEIDKMINKATIHLAEAFVEVDCKDFGGIVHLKMDTDLALQSRSQQAFEGIGISCH